MKNCKRWIANVVEILVGLALLIGNFTGLVDEYWSGMGTALIVVGGIFLIRNIRYRTNETYRDAVDVAVNDERNKYSARKAWSWAGYLFVMISAFASFLMSARRWTSPGVTKVIAAPLFPARPVLPMRWM